MIDLVYRGLVARFAAAGVVLAAFALLTLSVTVLAGHWQQTEMSQEEIYCRLGSAEDQIPLSQAVALLIRLLNEDRQEVGLQPVVRDPAAMISARVHAQEMANYRYLSHLDLAGCKPTWRYNAAGGTDQVAENLSYWEGNARIYLTPQLVHDIEERWMNSDEHRLNILAPAHTGVGVSIVLLWDGEKSVLTAAQEFVDDYGDFSRLPAKASSHDTLELDGRLDEGVRIGFVGIGYEPLPEPQLPSKLNAELNGYSLPHAFVGILPVGERFRRHFSSMPTLYLLQSEPARGRIRLKVTLEEVFAALQSSHFPAGEIGEFKPGLYYFLVFASTEKFHQFVISAQVVEIRS